MIASSDVNHSDTETLADRIRVGGTAMKARVIFAVVIFFSSYLFGQPNAAGSSNKSTFKGTYTLRTDQGPEVQSIDLTGGTVYQENGVLSCRNDCEAKLGGVLVQADEFDFETYRGEAKASGNVTIKPLPVTAAATRQP